MLPPNAIVSNSVAGFTVVRDDGTEVEIVRIEMLGTRSYVATDAFGRRWCGQLSDIALDELQPAIGDIFELLPGGQIGRTRRAVA